MSGICKYCGFCGTNDELAEHVGECPVMTADNSPTDEHYKENYVISKKLGKS